MQTDANGNAIVYDVMERHRGAGGPWTKNHGEYTESDRADAACTRLAAAFPEREFRPRKRRGLKATAYAA